MDKLLIASCFFALCLCFSRVSATAVAAVAAAAVNDDGVQAAERSEVSLEAAKRMRPRRSDDAGPLDLVVNRLSQEVVQLQAGLQALLNRAAGHDTQLQTLNNRAAELERSVGFTVRFSHETVSDLGLNQPVVFDRVDYNAGGGYDRNTGTFTAPVSGTYVFVLSLQRNDEMESTIIMRIMKGSVELGSAEAGYSRFEHGAMTVTSHLNQGDVITVRVVHGTTVYGNLATVFTGFRVSP